VLERDSSITSPSSLGNLASATPLVQRTAQPTIDSNQSLSSRFATKLLEGFILIAGETCPETSVPLLADTHGRLLSVSTGKWYTREDDQLVELSWMPWYGPGGTLHDTTVLAAPPQPPPVVHTSTRLQSAVPIASECALPVTFTSTTTDAACRLPPTPPARRPASPTTESSLLASSTLSNPPSAARLLAIQEEVVHETVQAINAARARAYPLGPTGCCEVTPSQLDAIRDLIVEPSMDLSAVACCRDKRLQTSRDDPISSDDRNRLRSALNERGGRGHVERSGRSRGAERRWRGDGRRTLACDSGGKLQASRCEAIGRRGWRARGSARRRVAKRTSKRSWCRVGVGMCHALRRGR